MDNDLHYFGFDQDPYEVRISKIEHMLSETNSILDQVNFRNQVQPYRNRVPPSYSSDMFSVPQYDSFSNSFYDSYDFYDNSDPYLRTDNSGWWETPNFHYRRELENFQQFQPELPTSPQLDFEDGIQSLEDVVRSIAASTQQLQASTQQFEAKTEASLQDISKHISQLAVAVNNLENQCELLVETTDDPAHDVNVVTLENNELLKLPESATAFRHGHAESTTTLIDVSNKVETQIPNSDIIFVCEDDLICPKKSVECMKDENEKAMKETFNKIEVSILSLDSIDHEHKFVEFIKEFCTKKK